MAIDNKLKTRGFRSACKDFENGLSPPAEFTTTQNTSCAFRFQQHENTISNQLPRVYQDL